LAACRSRARQVPRSGAETPGDGLAARALPGLPGARERNRKDPQMTPIAANLSNADLSDLAAYFSAQKSVPPERRVDPERASAGKRLSEKYYCVQCHGPSLLLGQQHIPRLAGQQAEY